VLLPAVLADRREIEDLVARTVDLGDRTGAVHLGRKLMSWAWRCVSGRTASMTVTCWRSDQARAVLRHGVTAPSTLATFLRTLTFGHVRQLDRVLTEGLGRACAAGARPGDDQLVVDVDSFVGEVFGDDTQRGLARSVQ
jgi:hypothetical protein